MQEDKSDKIKLLVTPPKNLKEMSEDELDQWASQAAQKMMENLKPNKD